MSATLMQDFPNTPTLIAAAETYCGRFAPSPTGPLHFGSLITALASYLTARAARGRWLLRIEDVDRARELPGAVDAILRALVCYGFEWEGEPIYQHHREDAYQAALDQLIQQGDAYGCACSRREVADSSLRGIDGPVYPNTCRAGIVDGRSTRAWRLRVDAGCITFDDGIQGRQTQDVACEVGDFVLRRADGYFAYQLAVVVDDAATGITHVVRGADLLDSTARQIVLQRKLGVATPQYAHVPVIVNAQGEKLSKQTRAMALPLSEPGRHLCHALFLLGLLPPAELVYASAHEVMHWGRQHWLQASPRAVRSVYCDLPTLV